VEKRAWKACECLAEKQCHEASKECWELKSIKKMEKQAAKEREAQECAEKAHVEAADEKAARE
jgi:hypothetical protein